MIAYIYLYMFEWWFMLRKISIRVGTRLAPVHPWLVPVLGLAPVRKIRVGTGLAPVRKRG
jgi:hypothetical protein